MSCQMINRTLGAAAAACFLLTAAAPVTAQAPAGPPGRADVSRVTGGVYKVDANHTQVIWTVDHLGVSPLSGMFGAMSGTLRLDPARPAAAQLDIQIPLTGLTTTSEGFGKHLRTPDLFDAAKFPTARFVSTSVRPQGTRATITGNLTLHGVTKPVVLDAVFVGAGPNPMSKAENLGFTATTTLKRSDWGLDYGVPMVSDAVKLQITGAFEKTS
jgi:polyisoprenoid-binding protein YceI